MHKITKDSNMRCFSWFGKLQRITLQNVLFLIIVSLTRPIFIDLNQEFVYNILKSRCDFNKRMIFVFRFFAVL